MTTITIENPNFYPQKGGKSVDTEKGQIFNDFLYDGHSTVALAQIRIRMGFLRKVFGILATQLLLTTLIAGVFLFTPGLKGVVQQWSWMVMIGFVLSIGLLIAMMVKRHETPTNYILLFLWTLCEAYTVGVTVSFFDQAVVLEAFLLTTVVVASLFIYTLQTKRDFTGWGPALFSIIWVVILASVLQMFLMSETLEFMMAAGGGVLFSLFIIFDLQMMIKKLSPEEYIMATINLYLDILNLFLHILRLLNMMKKD